MKRIIVFGVTLAALSMSAVLAKRLPPEEVAPIRSGDIEYRAPHDQMGCIEAWNTEPERLLWRRQIYVVRYALDLEPDVQDVFVTTIGLRGATLTVKNERDSEYELSLESLEVKVLKGSSVEEFK